MKRITSLLALGTLVLLALVAGVGARPASAVSLGTDASEPYPFIGAYKTDYPLPPGAGGNGCGVSVLAPEWGLTAAHCLKNNNAIVGTPKGWTVQVGSADVTNGGETVRVSRFFRFSNERPFGHDLMLLKFATPTTVTPISIADAVPTAGTPARFLGWGSTCDDSKNEPACYPSTLQQGEGEVRPIEDCPSSDPADGELCVRGLDGAKTGNADSGGPLLVKENNEWRLAGILSGPEGQNPDIAGLFTAVPRFRDWLSSTMQNADQLRDDDKGDPLAGFPSLGECAASIVRSTSSRDSDPAMLLTNGHCVSVASPSLKRPTPGKALTDIPLQPIAVPFTDDGGYLLTNARLIRLIYATMTGTDVALYAMDKTYDNLRSEGVKILTLTENIPDAGTHFTLQGGPTFACTVDAIIPRLEEAGYETRESIRYGDSPDCAPYAGLSGAPLIANDGHTVIGVHNTHSESGERCTEDNPCEVAQNGQRTAVEGRAYGQQVAGLSACLAPGSRVRLSAPECTLTGATGTPEAQYRSTVEALIAVFFIGVLAAGTVATIRLVTPAVSLRIRWTPRK
jgi:secreted trypsin-like serine protease